MNHNLIENKKTRQGPDSFHLVKLSNAGNILNISPPVDTSTTEILQPLHPQALENSSPEAAITNTGTPILKSTQSQQNANLLLETLVLKSTQNKKKYKLFT